MIIRGYDAINAAKQLHRQLGKYSEMSHRGFRLDLTVEEADELASRDQNLIFLELDVRKLNIEELLALSVALDGEPGRSFADLRDRYAREGDDDRAAIFEAMAARWFELRAQSH